jgi:hypothetical protein
MSKSVSQTRSVPSSRLAERAEELREPALRHIKFERLFVLAVHLHRDMSLGVLGHRGVHGHPLAARAAVDAVTDSGEQLLRPITQGSPEIARNYASPASDDPLAAIRTLIEGVRFAADSALEQAGFEPSVPLTEATDILVLVARFKILSRSAR